MKNVLMSIVALGAMSTSLYASCTTGSCSGKVERIYMTANGTMYVKVEGNAGTLNCTAPGGVYMSLKEGDAGKNSMYSLLLTAQTTGKRVTVRIEEGSSDCRVAFVKTL